MGKRGALLVVAAVAAGPAAGRPAAAQPGRAEPAKSEPDTEPGHRGPMIGTAIVVAGGPDDAGGFGGDLLLGWAGGQIAAGLWSRFVMEPNIDTHVMIGPVVRWWSHTFRRLYLEGRAGYHIMQIGEYEEPLDGPPGDDTKEGAFAGASIGFEVVRHPVIIPLDLRVGVDHVILDRDRTFIWVALGLTFY
jgi:hypothetical protein